ncbi:MAG: hypothetical protein RIQ56_812 [Candidatus Parcubacteria bacterium]|jgi:hypothetical protein
MRVSTVLGFAALLVSFALWAGVGSLFLHIRDAEDERRTRIAEIQQAAQEETDAVRIKTLLSETKVARMTLHELVSTDILSDVKMIEASGRPFGIQVNILNASPGGIISKNGTLRSISFTLAADGSFAALMKLLELYESFPLPSMIEQVSLAKTSEESKQSTVNDQWRLDFRFKVYTTVSISS